MEQGKCGNLIHGLAELLLLIKLLNQIILRLLLEDLVVDLEVID